MNISFEKSDLLYSLGILQGVSVKNEAMPILSNLMLDASHDNGIFFTGNNLECGVKTQVDGTVTDEGKVVVNSKKFLDMVKELPKGEISIQVSNKQRLNITAGKGKYTIIGGVADEFPELPVVDSEEKLSVDALGLNMCIQRVSYAAHADSSNALNSIHFNFLEDRTEVVATRRSVLSLATLPPLEESFEPSSLTIPMQAIREINRVFSNSDQISTYVTEQWLMFTDGTSILTSRIVEAESFPDYPRLIAVGQSKDTKTMSIMKDLFTNSLKQVLVLANPQNYSVKLKFHEDSLELSSNGPEIGNADNFTDIISGGFEDEIAVDGDLLLTMIGRIGSEIINIGFSQPDKPLFLNSASNDVDNLHVSLIMPVRITG